MHDAQSLDCPRCRVLLTDFEETVMVGAEVMRSAAVARQLSRDLLAGIELGSIRRADEHGRMVGAPTASAQVVASPTKHP